MFNIKTKLKKIIIIFLLFVLLVVVYFYHSDKKIKQDTRVVETKLTEQGFDKFYQKEDNEFCINIEDKQKQEDISRDMLWTLGKDNQDYKKIEKVECKNGGTGIKVK